MPCKRRSPLVPAREIAVRGKCPPRVMGGGYVPARNIGPGELTPFAPGPGGVILWSRVGVSGESPPPTFFPIGGGMNYGL